MAFLYNPDRMTEQEVRDAFVARMSLVDTMLHLIERQPDGAGVQHAVITGPRGMGKTTMLLMIQFRLAELELSKKWQPVKFPEESYSINDLADLWLEALHLLAACIDDTALESELTALCHGQLSATDLREHAWAMVKDWSASHEKRLLFLIDNFDMIIEQIGEEEEKSRLRDILMNDGTVMFIGTAVSFFKEAKYDKPFYHFFRVFDLKGLTHDDVVELLKRRSQIDGIEDFETILARNRGRLLALEYFTGGNPRLILMLYRVVTEWGSAEVRLAMEKLLDEVTPYYKSRTEILPAQQRKILDHIARESAKSFEGVSPSDIAAATRMKTNQASMQLKRLAEAGYVKPANIKGRSSCFALSEPLYAIWYQMRFSRTARERMLWLVSFLKVWFELPQLLKETKSVRWRVQEYCTLREQEKALYALEHGKYLLEAIPDGPEKAEASTQYLKSQMVAEDWEHVGETAARADLKCLTDRELEILYEKKGIEKDRFLFEKAWREYVAGRFEEAVRLLEEFIQINPDSHNAWYNRGLALDELNKYEAAIESYDKALQIKPDMYKAWNNKGRSLLSLEKLHDTFSAFDRAASLSDDRIPWENRAMVSIILSLKAFSENNPGRSLHYLNEARKSEQVIGPEQWMSLVLNTILSKTPIDNLPAVRKFLTQAHLDQQFFPLVRAIDYLETGNEELIEKLSPEYRKIVADVALAIKGRQAETSGK